MNRYLSLSFAIALILGFTSCQESLDEPNYKTSIDQDSIAHILQDALSAQAENPKLALNLVIKGLDMIPDEEESSSKGDLLVLKGDLYKANGKYEYALEYYEQAEKITFALGDSIGYSRNLGVKGHTHFLLGEYLEAIENLTKAILVLKRNKEKINPSAVSSEKIYKSDLCNLYIDFIELYTSIGEFEKGEAYADSCWNLSDNASLMSLKARLFATVGRLRMANGIYNNDQTLIQNALQHYRESNALYLSLGTPEYAEENYGNIANVFQYMADLLYEDPNQTRPTASRNMLDSSFFYITEYLQLSKSQNRLQGISIGLRMLAGYNSQIGEHMLAKNQVLQSLVAAGEIKSLEDSVYSYWQLSEIYYDLGQHDSVLWYFQEYDNIKSKYLKQNNAQNMAYEEAKYQTDIIALEKEQIKALSKQRFRNTLTIAGTGAVVLLVLIGYFYMRNQQQRKLMSQQSTMNRQLVVDLIKEQAIESLNAKLEGQEKERKRIARELHDRLGGTLAAAKLSLEGLGRRLGGDHKDHYNHAQDLLQMAYQETRQLSHDMMALPLKHLGLEASFQALCDTINKSDKIEVTYDATFQTTSFLSPEAEIHLYRILQELLQNVIKHARATQVFVQITQTLEEFTLLVEDNGRGFPKNTNKSGRGMGLSNIQDRISHLKGTLEIDSQAGKGSTIIIQLPPIT
ncbi:MAG: ATP-binding protein [Bacteroidota bacterium]